MSLTGMPQTGGPSTLPGVIVTDVIDIGCTNGQVFDNLDLGDASAVRFNPPVTGGASSITLNGIKSRSIDQRQIMIIAGGSGLNALTINIVGAAGSSLAANQFASNATINPGTAEDFLWSNNATASGAWIPASTAAGSVANTGRFVGIQVLTTGAVTYTPSAGVTRAIATLIGGGGGSGGVNCTVATQVAMSGGGGGGSQTTALLTGLSSATPLACSIGAAGTAGTAAPTAGGNGGPTTLGPAGLITAPGGNGSAGVSGAAVAVLVGPGAPPSAAGVNGLIAIGGANGEDGVASNIGAGTGSGGNGGSTAYGNGGQGNHTAAPGGVGNVGTGFGAGGGGSSALEAIVSRVGAVGTAGAIVIAEYT